VFWLNIGLKGLFVGLLAFGAFSGLDQFEGKAFGWRLILYPIAALIVPVAWRCFGSPQPYPYGADMLLVAPFLIDVAGNALDLYDSISWWDDLNHLVNWAILVAAFGQLLLRLPVAPWAMFGLAVGFGAVTAILWELAEYFTFIRSNPDEYRTAYTDTLGDLTLGLTGSVCAALLTVWLARRRGQRVTGTVPVTPRAAA
jgi:hypothetical protein